MKTFSLVFFIFYSACQVMAQPANDLCADATLIPQSITCVNIAGTTTNATATVTHPRNIIPCGSFFSEAGEAWYKVVIGDDGNATVTVSDNGSSLDFMMVAMAPCGAADDIACNDDANGTIYPEISLTGRTPGETIFFSVEGFQGGISGPFNICAITAPYTSLPVELSDISASVVGRDMASLDWETMSETNNAGFQIERTSDLLSWEYLGFVDGNGTTSAVNGYRFIDEHPVKGTNYYRLKQVDFDGSEHYTEVVSVKIDSDEPALSIWPNPIPTSNTLNVQLAEATEGLLRLTTATGQEVLKKYMDGDGAQLSLRLPDLPAGLYFIEMQSGSARMVERLLVE